MPQLSLHSPLGALTLSQEDEALVALDFGWGRDQDATALLREARSQLQAYFDGERRDFTVALAPSGTRYQRRVWDLMACIPFGDTRTFAAVAHEAGGTARSVGQVRLRNPLPILIPGHRVVAGRGPMAEDDIGTSFLLELERRE